MNRLGDFWRQRGTLGKVVIVVLAGVVVYSIYGAITSGSDDDTTSPPATTATEAEAAPGDPMTCLEDAGLSGVEQRSSDFWRGNHESPFYQVSVKLLPSDAEAEELVAEATDAYAAQAGAYVVTGPESTSEESVEAEAEALVEEVATCLGG